MTCCSNNSGTGSSMRVSLATTAGAVLPRILCRAGSPCSWSHRKSRRSNFHSRRGDVTSQRRVTTSTPLHTIPLHSSRPAYLAITYHSTSDTTRSGRPVSTDDRISSRFAASRPPSTCRPDVPSRGSNRSTLQRRSISSSGTYSG